jgi:hypothetical protein
MNGASWAVNGIYGLVRCNIGLKCSFQTPSSPGRKEDKEEIESDVALGECEVASIANVIIYLILYKPNGKYRS